MSYDAPFAGLKVVDLSQGVAGPYCGMLLAQHGASDADRGNVILTQAEELLPGSVSPDAPRTDLGCSVVL